LRSVSVGWFVTTGAASIAGVVFLIVAGWTSLASHDGFLFDSSDGLLSAVLTSVETPGTATLPSTGGLVVATETPAAELEDTRDREQGAAPTPGIETPSETPRMPILTLIDAAAPAERQNDCEYYRSTRHNICSVFMRYWQDHRGWQNFGYPLTEEIQVAGVLVQYFEYAKFEMHPDLVGTQYEVLLARLGAEASRSADATVREAVKPEDARDCDYFETTGHNLCARFLDYWSSYGGLPVFGYPLTEQYEADGLIVQDFERTRLAWDPNETSDGFGVVRAQLGGIALERDLANSNR